MTALMEWNEIRYRARTPLFQYHQFQGNTNNCGPTSLAIAANAYLGEDRFQGDQVARELDNWRSSFPHLILPRIKNWMTFPWGIVQYLMMHGIPARWAPFGQPNKLVHNLINDRITMVVIGEVFRWNKSTYAGWGHVKVLFGFDPDLGYVFVDPAYAKLNNDPDAWKSIGLNWQKEDTFIREWRNLMGIYIEIGKN
jgi:hypothetical protein